VWGFFEQGNSATQDKFLENEETDVVQGHGREYIPELSPPYYLIDYHSDLDACL